MQALLEIIVCKFGGDPAICLLEEAICAKVYRRTHGRTTDAAPLMMHYTAHKVGVRMTERYQICSVKLDTIDFRFRFSAESHGLLSVAHTVSAECVTSLSAYLRFRPTSTRDRLKKWHFSLK